MSRDHFHQPSGGLLGAFAANSIACSTISTAVFWASHFAEQ
jgi:hypothetical protein